MNADPPRSPGEPPPSDSIARNTGSAFVGSMVSAAFTAALTLFLLRALGPRQYGVFALALSVGALVLLPSNLGISAAAARFVADARRDRVAVLGVVSDALRLKLVVSLLFSLGLAALAGPIAAAYDAPALEWPIRIMAVAILAESLLQLFDQLFEAEGKMSFYLRVVGAESAAEAVSSIALVLAGFGVAGAVAGRAGAYLFAVGYAFVLLIKVLGTRPALRGPSAGNIGRIARYGSALIVIDGAFTLFNQIDALLIGAIISVTAVGQFQAPMRLVAFLSYPGAAVASGVGPRVAAGHEGPSSGAFEGALRRLAALQGVFIAPLIVWAEPLTRLVLGPKYAPSAEVMRAIAPYAFLIAISPVLARAITYLGEARLRIPIAIGALLVNVVFDLIFLPRMGIVAGAIGTDIAYTLYAGAHLWLCRRLIGTRIRPLAVTFLRVLVAVAGMSVVLLVLGTGSVSTPVLIAGGVLGSLVYVAILLATREITTAELRSAWATLARARKGP
jgi:O-antigen/teichoic acid export membrane protein